MKKLSDEEKLIQKQKRELAKKQREEEDLQEELKIKKEKEEFHKTIPKKMLQLLVRAIKHNLRFEIFVHDKNEEMIQINFDIGDDGCYRPICFESDEWAVESLESEFDYLDAEIIEKERKKLVRQQALEKIKNVLTTEEIELLRGYL